MTVYYSDDPEKKFNKILFRPGFGLQSRELNSIQDISANNFDTLTRKLYKPGDPISGGSIKHGKANTVKIHSTHTGVPVVLEDFIDKIIVELDNSNIETGATGRVIAVSAKTDSDFAAIHYVSTSEKKFKDGYIVRVRNESSAATIARNDQPITTCLYARLSDGIFSYKSSFVEVESQTLVYSKFSSDFTGSIGLRFTETIVTEIDDDSLYDPANGHKNYNAPGAHRLKITGKLDIGTSIDDNFVILDNIKLGHVTSNEVETDKFVDMNNDVLDGFNHTVIDRREVSIVKIEPSVTALTLHVVTSENHNYQAGDKVKIIDVSEYVETYTINKIINDREFYIDTTIPPVVTKLNTGYVYRTDYFTVQLDSGRAVIDNMLHSKTIPTQIELRKAKDERFIENASVDISRTGYMLVDMVSGAFSVDNISDVDVYDGTTLVGSVKLSSIEYVGANKYKLYLGGVSISPLSALYSITEVKQSVASGAVTNVDAVATIVEVNNHKIACNIRDENLFSFKISNNDIKTLKKNQLDKVSYPTQKSHFMPSSGVYDTQILLPVNETFLGPLNNEMDLDFFRKHYAVFDKTTGVSKTGDVNKAIITNEGRTLTLTFNSSSTNVILYAPSMSEHDISVLIPKTSNIVLNHGILNGVNPVYTIPGMYLAHTLKIIDSSNNEDITEFFELDRNINDWSKAESQIRLKPGFNQSNSIIIEVDGYENPNNVSELSVLTVDSYQNQNHAPLNNALDFSFTSDHIESNRLPHHSGKAIVSYVEFPKRVDSVVIDLYGNISVVEGTPSSNPQPPHLTNKQLKIVDYLITNNNISYYDPDYTEDDQFVDSTKSVDVYNIDNTIKYNKILSAEFYNKDNVATLDSDFGEFITAPYTDTIVISNNSPTNAIKISHNFSSKQFGIIKTNANKLDVLSSNTIKIVVEAIGANTDLYVFFNNKKVDVSKINNLGDNPVSDGVIRSNVTGSTVFEITIDSNYIIDGDNIIEISDSSVNAHENANNEAMIVLSTEFMKSGEIRQLQPVIDTVDKYKAERELISQTFTISDKLFPNGMFLDHINLYFANKPTSGNNPVVLKIHEVINGKPSDKYYLPLSVVSKLSSEIQIPISETDVSEINSTPTKFKFDVPVYLKSGSEYAVVIQADSPEYKLFVTTQGYNVLGTNKRVQNNPTLGSIYRYDTGWKEELNVDLSMDVSAVSFSTINVGTIGIRNSDNTKVVYDAVKTEVSLIDFDDITTEDKLTDARSLILNKQYVGLNKQTVIYDSAVVDNIGNHQQQLTIKTTDQFTAPLIDAASLKLYVRETLISDNGLQDYNFSITNPGSGYTTAVATITGGYGSGAAISLNLNNGSISSIKVLSSGSGYTSTPNVQISGDGGGANIDVIAMPFSRLSDDNENIVTFAINNARVNASRFDVYVDYIDTADDAEVEFYITGNVFDIEAENYIKLVRNTKRHFSCDLTNKTQLHTYKLKMVYVGNKRANIKSIRLSA